MRGVLDESTGVSVQLRSRPGSPGRDSGSPARPPYRATSGASDRFDPPGVGVSPPHVASAIIAPVEAPRVTGADYLQLPSHLSLRREPCPSSVRSVPIMGTRSRRSSFARLTERTASSTRT